MDQRNCEVLTTDIEWPHMRVFIYVYLLWITVWSFDFELRGKNDNGFNPPPSEFGRIEQRLTFEYITLLWQRRFWTILKHKNFFVQFENANWSLSLIVS